METYELANVISQQRDSTRPYLEFLRHSSMSVGLYVLPVNAADGQKPHTEDELYFVVSGKANIRVGDEDRPVRSGSLVFVAVGVPHHFYNITEDLSVLVFFAPAEYTNVAKA